MNSQASRRDGLPILVGLESHALERISLMNGTASLDEAWLQNLLFGHPEVLPLRDIEPGFTELIAVCRELPTAHGPVDNLFITAQGNIVLVEAKLWRNPQARREVVAQALDYASCLFDMDYEAFEAAALKGDYGGAPTPKTLYSLVEDKSDALIEQGFVDAVARNLERGRIVILLVGDGIRAETERLVGSLQSHAGFHFTLALVELAIFRMTGSENLIVQPRTLTRTTMIERGIVRVEDGRIKIAAAPSNEATSQSSLGSISAEQFFEAMAARDPRAPIKLREFLSRLETLGVYTDLQRSLSLKWDDTSGQAINLGYIMRDGQIWTEGVNRHAPSEISHRYIEELAAAWNADIVKNSLGQLWHVRVKGKAPRIETVIDKLDRWYDCIERFVTTMRREDASALVAPRQSLGEALAAKAAMMSGSGFNYGQATVEALNKAVLADDANSADAHPVSRSDETND